METTGNTPIPEPAPTGFVSRNRRWLATGGAALALLTAGFGVGVAGAQDNGGDGTTTTTEAPSDEAPADDADRPTEEELQAFRDCMAENGVDLPDERPAPGEREERTEEERQAFQDALDACEDLKPEGFGRCGPGGPGGPNGERPEDDAPAEEDTQGS